MIIFSHGETKKSNEKQMPGGVWRPGKRLEADGDGNAKVYISSVANRRAPAAEPAVAYCDAKYIRTHLTSLTGEPPEANCNTMLFLTHRTSLSKVLWKH